MLTNLICWLGHRLDHLGHQLGRRFGLSSKPILPRKSHVPLVVPRSQHSISRANISKQALKVLYGLKDAGFEAYLVGGGVRDVLLNRHPKDFDVATNAHPEQVQKLFRNCRLIGRRFRLAHVHFGPHIVEVATFRANPSIHSEEGMILRDNIFGTVEEDAWRRDFTVNALYYNIADFSLIDFVGGLRDLKKKTLRMIGDIKVRYREDPVRMLRAIRFAAKLNFSIHVDSEKPIFEMSHLIKQVPAARLFDEYTKLFLSGFAESSFKLLCHYGFFSILFPQVMTALKKNHDFLSVFIHSALVDTDKRFAEHKPISLPFLLAAFLWGPTLLRLEELKGKEMSMIQAFYKASDETLERQQKGVTLSRRVIQQIREIWQLQMRLTHFLGKRAEELYHHPRFRAAFDFLNLRAKAGDPLAQRFVQWWQSYATGSPETRLSLIAALGKGQPRRRRNKRFRQKRNASSEAVNVQSKS